MAISVTLASAINTLLYYMLPAADRYHEDPPNRQQAIDAAAELADAANKSLSAGISGADVRRAWPHNHPGPRGNARK